MDVKYRTVASPKEGLEALRNGEIDALAYDRPILAWMIREGGLTADLGEVTFEPQDYALRFAARAAAKGRQCRAARSGAVGLVEG